MATVLARKKARRNALRKGLKNILDEASTALGDAETNEARLIAIKGRVVSSVESLNALDDEIVNSLDPDAIEEDVLESISVVEPTHEIVASLQLRMEKLRIEQLKVSNSDAERATSSASSTTKSCRLPKLELPTFKGEVLEWRGFFEQFSKIVDEDEELSEINKFIYLKRYLSGQALSFVSGLSLTAGNYKDALELLKGRYGNPKFLFQLIWNLC